MAFEQSPQNLFSYSVSNRTRAQTASREYGEAKSNCDYGAEKGLENLLFLWRENYGGFRAEVVVFNHPLGFGFKSKAGSYREFPISTLVLRKTHVPTCRRFLPYALLWR